jgi:6-phosphogluconolactonase
VTGDATEVVVHADAGMLAEAVAARLLLRLLDAQAARGTATLVLTGGRIAEKIYEAVRNSPLRDAVDWSRVDLWWGDERFLPSGDPDRNETQVRAALIDALPVPAERVHPMPASDGPDGDDADAAARRYATELGAAGPTDLVLLGIGEDAHVASIFPGHPEGHGAGPVSAVRNSPKPPPVRLTLTMPVLNAADEVWVLASGDGKADAVAAALTPGADPGEVPASGVHGARRTLWLLDRDAAVKRPG